MLRAIHVTCFVLWALFPATLLHAQPAEEIPGGSAPMLRLTAQGPLSQITSMAFSPNGQTLYAGGWDKVVHVWTREANGFTYDRDATYRIPIGGGLDGGINVVTISEDGQWLAIGGRGAKRGVAGQRDFGYLIPARGLSPEAWKDEGQIYVFNTSTRECRTLRGHRGAVIALTFAPARKDHGPVLISVSSTNSNGQEGAQLIAWDVETSRPVNSTEYYSVEEQGVSQAIRLPRINVSFPPRPVGWWTGPGEKDLKIAVTWGTPEFGLRIWDLKDESVGWPADDDPLQYFTLAAKEPGTFFSGGGNTKSGQVEFGIWSMPQGPTNPNRSQNYSSLHTFGSEEFVTNIVAGSHGSGPVVVVTDMQRKNSRLVVMSPDGRQVVKDVPLWDGLFASTLARAHDEGTFAVSRAGTAEISVYSGADLERGQESQRLRLEIPQLEQVTFMANGDDAGLKLKQSGQPEMILDLARSRWVPAEAPWSNNSLDTSAWTITPAASEAGQITLSVTDPNQKTSTIQVRSRTSTEEIPALIEAAVFPGNDELPVPWLVCAIQTNLQPELQVYDLRNGEQVRQLTAHTGLIRDLTISGDGRFVASVGADHKLCVWRMSDLASELGQHGLIRDGNELLEVEVLDNGKMSIGNTVGNLREEMEILGAVIHQEQHSFSNARKFYLAIHSQTPGDQVTLKTDRGDVPVIVGQSIDDRKPLFSVFVTPTEKLADWQWIGWNPLGPYEASEREIEQSLGWHFNTGEPQSPTRFAAAEGYRDAYETPRLLNYLYHRETLPPRAPPAPPTMSLIIQEPQGTILSSDFGGLIPISNLKSTVVFQAAGKQLSEILETSEFVLENGKDEAQVLPANLTGQGEWRIELSEFNWQRGRNRLTARLTTNEFPPRQFEEAIHLRYQPPPPVVKLESLKPPVAMAKQEFRFNIVPSNVPAEILLRQRNAKGGVVAEHRWQETLSEAATLSHQIELRPGINEIEVIASNVDPLYGFEWAETASQTIEIPYQKPVPIDPPKIVELNVNVAQHDPMPFAAGEAIEIDSPSVLISGHVKSTQPVQSLQIKVGDQTTTVDALKGKKGELDFSQEIQLKPGPQPVTVRIEMKGDLHDESSSQLTYRPQLPFVKNYQITPVLLQAQPDSRQNGPVAGRADGEIILIEDQHQPWVIMTADLQRTEDDTPFDVKVMIDGQLQPEVIATTEGDSVSAKAPVSPGRHRLQFRVENNWQRASETRDAIVVFRRPPQIEMVAAENKPVDNPRVDQLEFVVTSPEELPPLAEKVRVMVNDSPVPCVTEVTPLKNDRWKVAVREIVLDREGENTAKIQVANAEGFSTQEVVQSWTLTKPPKLKPEINVEKPGSQTRDRSVRLEFSVQSDSSVQTVLVERIVGGVARKLASTRAEGAPPLTPERVFGGSATYEVPVRLSPGVNELRVTAVNAGGTQVITQQISCTPMPIQVKIERLGEIHPARINENLDFGGPLATSHADLIGIIEWDPDEKPPEFAQFWVNGFMQQSAKLEEIPNQKRQKRFHVSLNFSRDKQNTIEVSLPGYAVDAVSRKHMMFAVDCDQPLLQQDLHLLIIGTLPPALAPPDYRQILEHRAEDALRARIGPDQRLQSSAFSEIHSTVLTGRDARYTRINSALANLRFQLHPPTSRRTSSVEENVVLMVYYHGREMLVHEEEGDTFVLATTETWENPAAQLNKSLKNTDLSNLLSKYYGAHLLFLDVESVNNMGAEARWPDDPHLGIVRTVWGGNRWSPDSPLLMNAVANTSPNVLELGELISGIEQSWSTKKPLITDFKIPSALKRLELRGRTMQ